MNKNGVLQNSIVAAAIVLSVIIASYSFVNRNSDKNTISVTGLSERNFESDLIVWKSQFTVKNSSLTAAYSEIKSNNAIITNFLTEKGIKNEEMTFSAVEIAKEYIYTNGPGGTSYQSFDGYRLNQSVSISSGDVEKIEKLSREITELINKGIEITSMPPQYYYTKLANLKLEMLAEATKDGLQRAETIAENGDASLGSLVNSTQGVFQIVGFNSAEDYSWGGAFNTSSKKKTASVTVKLMYKAK
jgi:hypothetical protein